MGTLKPGVTYIYERDDKKVYAREVGADPSTRQLIGYDWPVDNQPLEEGLAKFRYEAMWRDIHQAAKHNLTLQDALDRVIEIYELVKNNE